MRKGIIHTLLLGALVLAGCQEAQIGAEQREDKGTVTATTKGVKTSMGELTASANASITPIFDQDVFMSKGGDLFVSEPTKKWLEALTIGQPTVVAEKEESVEKEVADATEAEDEQTDKEQTLDQSLKGDEETSKADTTQVAEAATSSPAGSSQSSSSKGTQASTSQSKPAAQESKPAEKKAESKPAPAPAKKPATSAPAAKPAPKAEPKPAPKPAPKPEPKPEPKPNGGHGEYPNAVSDAELNAFASEIKSNSYPYAAVYHAVGDTAEHDRYGDVIIGMWTGMSDQVTHVDDVAWGLQILKDYLSSKGYRYNYQGGQQRFELHVYLK